MLKILSALCALLILAIVFVLALVRKRFQAELANELRLFTEGRGSADQKVEREFDLDYLPPAVKRYLSQSLGPRAPQVSLLRIKQTGRFRMKPGQAWMPLHAEEYFRADRPGYFWTARIRIFPGLWFDVRDFYWNARGEVLARLASVFPVAQARGSEVDQGAFVRWVAEVPWFPQAFLNRQIFSWEDLGERRARLTARDGERLARFDCSFSADGLIERMTTNDRPFETAGSYARRPYSGTYTDWRDVNGMKLPFQGGATWHLPNGDFTYVTIEQLVFDFEVSSRFFDHGSQAE